ncbi:MAG: 30S ribosomal protein S1 [Thermomicrobiales bacterium]
MDRSDFDEAATRLQGSVGFKDDEAADEVGRSLMEQLLADPTHDYRTLKYGDVIDGTVMHVDRDEILVDIGSKSEGVIPAREFSTLDDQERKSMGVGDQLLVFVVQPENSDGHAVVSIDRARQEKSWRILQEQYEGGLVIAAEVVNYNKGGLLVNLDGVRGFVPASQVTEIRGGDDAQKQADMARLIGNSLQLKIIEINRHRNRLILSERQALQERRDEMKEKLIEQLREGEVRQGRVSSICDFGAFVDVGGADGLVHLSELSWSRVRHPSEVLHVGQEVDVFVLGINAEEKKIALSIKRTQAEPWSRVAAKYDVNQLVVGTVTQLANFGAFARIEDGIEGLVHVSELSDARISHPRQLVSEGQDLLLRIIRIDPQRRRMGLSLRRALEATDEEVLEALDQVAVELKERLLALEVEPDPDAEDEPERIPAPAAIAADTEPDVEVESAPAPVAEVEESNAMTEAFAAAEANVTPADEVTASEPAAVADEPEPPVDVAVEVEAATESAVETETAVETEAETEVAAVAEETSDATPVDVETEAGAEAEVDAEPVQPEVAPAKQTGDVRIEKVLSNPADEPGAKHEYVDITNHDSDPIELEGWRLTDSIDTSYTFPAFVLEPGATVRLHVSRGKAKPNDLYWGRTSAVWNNEGDTANLYDASGTLVHTLEVPASVAAGAAAEAAGRGR